MLVDYTEELKSKDKRIIKAEGLNKEILILKKYKHQYILEYLLLINNCNNKKDKSYLNYKYKEIVNLPNKENLKEVIYNNSGLFDSIVWF